MLNARHTIMIVGWDIDSRTPLVGADRPCRDGLPETLGPFLAQLVERNPKLKIRLLLWDFSNLYALEREAFPRQKLAWEGITLKLDDTLPASASQHQKLVIVDDAVAFSGGLDVTIRRWDRDDHPYACRERCDPTGEPYDPFHDVQAVVDGDAARALADLANERWAIATGEHIAPSPSGDPWPEGVDPNLTGVQVGLSRTRPATEFHPACEEVEKLFIRMIESAERYIYIENQYLTSVPIAEALARQLRANPELQVLIIAPKSHDAWLEALTMRNGRIRFAAIVKAAGGDRVRLAYPAVHRRGRSKAMMVHSKVMIIDEAVLRIGSANLNNRSMGTDSECDLTVVASDACTEAAIARVRARLLAVHTGVRPEAAAAAVREHRLIGASRDLNDGTHRLHDIDDGTPIPSELAQSAAAIGDPERPVDAIHFLAGITGEPPPSLRRTAVYVLGGVAAALIAVAFAWAWFANETEVLVVQVLHTPSHDVASVATLLLLFVAASLLLMPITVLIAAATAALGLAVGIPLAATGTLVSAIAAYGFGRMSGQQWVRPLLGGRIGVLRNAIVRHGVPAVAAIRLVPIAPFTVVNLAAGAIRVGPTAFIAGTMIGMAPGFLILALLGRQLHAMWTAPSWPATLLVLALLLTWLAISIIAQHVVKTRKLLHG